MFQPLAVCVNISIAPALVCTQVYIEMGFLPLSIAYCWPYAMVSLIGVCFFSVNVFRFLCGLQKVHVCAIVDRCAITSAQILSQTWGCTALIFSQGAPFSQWNSITDGFGLLEQVRGIPCIAFCLQFCGLRAVAFH